MIKTGDKVVCIKEYETLTINTYISRKANYRKGFTYEVLGISKTTGRVYIKCDNGDYTSFGIVDNLFNSDFFLDYFIPLAEFRENQIKSVLDD